MKVIFAVYIVEVEALDRYKIGCAAFPEPRIDALRTAGQVPLRLLRVIRHPQAKALERILHERYAAHRRHGEWFDLPKEVLTSLLAEPFDDEVIFS